MQAMDEGTKENAAHFRFIGGELCLDFANTIGNRCTEDLARDYLHGYADILLWARLAEVVEPSAGRELAATAQRMASWAEAVWQRARTLRETIYRLFAALAAGRRPARSDIEVLNSFALEAQAHRRIVAQSDGYGWQWHRTGALDDLLWPIAWSAAELLVSSRRQRILQCAAEECGWLFLDTSRNHARRWCDMRDCGNRAKVRRHYRRQLHS